MLGLVSRKPRPYINSVIAGVFARAQIREGEEERQRVAFIAIVTKRLYSPGRKQRKRKFHRSPLYYVYITYRGCVCASQPRLPLSGSECARACACIAYTQRSTISSRGREYENTYAPCTARVRILLALREPRIFTTSSKWREEATFAPEPKCQRREKGFESFQRN